MALFSSYPILLSVIASLPKASVAISGEFPTEHILLYRIANKNQ